ncbi:MAG: DUF934 domain-containing protein [Porticoccaceae bacterium]|jgi:uncharacterized protein (DUF934 family)|nr:DUF934 domain-containing protein [Porticoccaceae bacterium]MBT7375207.1 DUF934 domain-containing protein [Porticoccaceae bacterium]
MAQLLKQGQVTVNNWQTLDTGTTELPSGNLLVPVELWQQLSLGAEQHSGEIGLWLDGSEEIEQLADLLIKAPVIGIRFSKFADGRGFSMARLLRERYGYQGELRATGDFIRDQLYFLQRCGFTSYEFDDSVDVAEASKSLNDFTDAYQVAVDQQVPLFKRR